MKKRLSLYIISLFCLQACKQAGNRNAAENEIRNLLAAERKAHFDRDVELFVQEFSDSMLSVNKGKIKATPPDTMRKSISRYFNSVKFIKWDDMAPPVIRLSDDGSLAYVLVQKEVIVSYPDTAGGIFTDTTHFAWASIYRKQNSEWKVEANISTNK